MAGRKVLVTGASGLLGREIVKHFRNDGWDVLGLAYSRIQNGLVKVDLKDPSQVKQVFNDYKPNIVVHSAAERRPDKMENDLEGSRMLNVSSTETVTKLCKEHNCFLVYISTDYVFDGESPPYKAADKTNPLNAYGLSKRDGEIITQSYSDSAIVRVPVLYGSVETIDESAVTILYNAVKSGKPETKLSNYEIRFPTHTSDVARVIVGISSKALDNRPLCCGVWHYSAPGSYTKYTMARVMGVALGIDVSHLKPVNGPSGGAPRPYNAQLDSTTTFEAFGCQPTFTFKDSIHDALKLALLT